MPSDDLLLQLLRRFSEEHVDYVLIGGQAVRLNGFVRATEDVDVLLKSSRENGERVIRALNFLASAKELDADWFAPSADGEVENIRVADVLLVDLLFAANGEHYEAFLPFVREILVDEVPVRVLNIDGLIRSKTDYREKDLLDKQMLRKLKNS